MLEDLLDELSSIGWTISWAFQYSPGEWRLTIIREEDIGAESGTYFVSCAFAPTFREALEDAMGRINEAEYEAAQKSGLYAGAALPKPKPSSLLSTLGFKSTQQPLRRL